MAVFHFIEGFGNPTRRHSAPGDFSPIEYETRAMAENGRSLPANHPRMWGYSTRAMRSAAPRLGPVRRLNSWAVLVLTDEQWAVLEPLLEACRPPAKVPPRHLRRTVSAILWRHANGAKWRAIPDAFGPWWVGGTAPDPRRRSSGGRASASGSGCSPWPRRAASSSAWAGGMPPALDGTSIHAHRKAAGATKTAPLRRNGVLVRRSAVLMAATGPRLA